MSKHDYYEILGIGKSATSDEIKKAYRRRAFKYHPVKNQGDKAAEEKFKELSEAYEALGDPDKRASYDQFGHEGLKSTFGKGGFQWQNFTHFGDFEDIFSGLGDLFRGFGADADLSGTGWGAGQRRAGPRRGRDIGHELEIEFTEAALGVEKSVEILRNESCDNCKGSGAKPGEKAKKCSYCNGKGEVRQEMTIMGHRVGITASTCPKCSGAGSIIEKLCTECNGRGKVREARRIKVKVPAGVDNGVRLRVSREGDAGEKGGPRGDLYVSIYVREHELFKRHDSDIYCEAKISFTQAVFGCEVRVPTLEGKVSMKVPKGTQSGKIFRLKGKGIQNLFSNAGRGDQLVKVTVAVPRHLNEEQKAILKEFARTLGEENAPGPKGFFEKVKKTFG